MAEFKLGRIKFVWKGDWTAGQTYYVDDVIRYGGRTYICRIGHTSASNFYTDESVVPTKWNQMSDGTDWKGDWAVDTFYKENDIVKYGGLLYICNDSHTSSATAESGVPGLETATGLEADDTKWTLYSEGFDWKEEWTTTTRYKKNDLVKYGGYTYVCNTAHTSAATVTDGIEVDQLLWDEFNQGIEYKADWTSSFKYKINDVVKYGAGLWICTTAHTSTSVFADDDGNWSQFLEGFEFEEQWNISTVYQPGDVVQYGGNLYISRTNHVGATPSTSGINWSLFTEGFNWSSDWAINASYRISDVVRVNGTTYLATADSPSVTRTITATNAGTSLFTGSTTGLVAGLAVQFTGTTFGDVFNGATYYIKSVAGPTTFTISTTPGGTTFVPDTATGSMTATIAAHPTNISFWSRLNSGISWQGLWLDDQEYEQGDAVRYGNNAYICILKHRSESDDGSTVSATGGGAVDSRPDLDDTGTYWNILSVGSETSVLTTRGDMVYYGGSGPTRLPIGKEGQILRAGINDPEWVTLGDTDFKYYVAPHGIDSPAPIFGKTPDKPWKTIRYACEQVENGPRNPDTQKLLELNRVFIQREVTEWIDYQIASATVGSIWYNFDYDEHKCERDTGFLVDRLIWDLGHGGNLKMRAAAQAYVNALGEGPFSTEDEDLPYAKLSTEADNDVAAFNYMLTLVEKVIANEAPAVNYQTLNGDNSTSTVAQYFNTDLVAEEGVFETITALVGIVTQTLTDQNTDNLVERYTPQNLIRVATGRYRETLPIVVPAYTCVQGDELRSTNAGPAGSLVSEDDVPYSVAALERFEEVVGDIVVGTTVTESAGNAESQDIAWPYADAVQVTKLTQLIRGIGYDIDFRVGTTTKVVLTNPTGYNTSYLIGYGDARALVSANKNFFKEQVKAYLNTNYPNLKYSRTSCLRDVGYIVDAVVYDLTYGGNSQSVVAGLAYYEGVGSSLYIDSTEKTATLQAYAYLKTMLQDAALSNPIAVNQIIETQTTGTPGSAGAAAFIGANIDELIDIVDNGPSAATLTDPAATNGVSSTTALINAYNTLQAAVPTIQTSTIDYINSNFGDFTYNSSLCRRDAGYLIDAAYYDAAFGSNFWAVQNGLSYLRAQSSIVTSLQLEQEIGAIDYIKEQAAISLDSSATAISRSNAAYTEIIDIIQNGVGAANSLVYTDTGTANFTNARAQLVTNRAFIISEISSWLNTNYNSVWTGLGAEGQATCQRDVGYTIDALAYDVNYGGNIATRNVARSLFSAITGLSVYPDAPQKAASAAMYTQLGVICDQIVQETYAGQDTSGTAASATEGTRMITLTGNINSVIVADTLSGLVAESVPSITWIDDGIETAVGELASDKTDIVAGTLQYISDTFNSFTYNQAKCSRDVATILKAVGYDFMFNSNFQTLKSAYSYLRATAVEVFSLGQKTITRAALEYVRTQAVANVGADATAIARINASMQIIDDIIYIASNEGQVCQTESRTDDYAILQLERNRAFIVAEITAWVAATYPSYTYNVAACERDVNTYIDALKWDLKYAANYKSKLVSRYYANAVKGSLEEDMYYLRDATGLRDMTLDGLSGDLLPENEYGTSRVSAGAYASLDPGWGPDDFRTWIITRSPYVQGLTTLGNAAVGQKIDGALHNGGNDSIVSNDFTQVISDGIGAWVTNNGRAELVSVFTYYAHIGYLSENGGRIRGTNGNNSYGDFGSVAEGVDNRETPNTGVVDNRFQFEATVDEVLTNGSALLRFEFGNAGIDYSKLNWTVTGGGVNASVLQDEFRDGGVYQVRLLDFGDDSSGQFGGDGYITNSNTAQGGTSTQITIAATDSETSSAYVGMKIYLDGGTAVGQFGIINTYNSGSKIATIIKESDGTSGWDHVVPGTTIVSPDASTTYIIEPRLLFSAPGFASTEQTIASGDYSSVVFGETAGTYTPVTGTYSGAGGTGATFQVIRNGWKYIPSLVTGGTGYTRLETITILGTDLGGLTPDNDLVITITSVNAITGAIVEFDEEGYGVGGRFVAIRSGSAVGVTSEDGQTWTPMPTGLPGSSSWSSVAFGTLADGSSTNEVSRFVAVATGSATAAYSEDGITWTASTLPAADDWTSVTFGNGRFVAVSSDNTVTAISFDGETWDTTGTISAGGFIEVTYGKGLFVAVRASSTVVATSPDGVVWTDRSLPNAAWTSVTWGNNRFVAVASDSNSGAYSLDGITWAAMTIGSADGSTVGGYQQVRYGQGLFMATAYQAGVDNYSFVVTSENGIYWTVQGVVSSGIMNGYKAIAFGNPQRSGRWVTIVSGTGTTAALIITGARARARAAVAENKIFQIRIVEPGSGYGTAPTLTIVDPNNTYEAPTAVRIGNGVAANPTFINRGSQFVTGSAEQDTGDGYADNYQTGGFVAVRRLTQRPVPGSNIVFDGLPDKTFKLVNVLTFLGQNDGSYTAFFQVSPTLTIAEAQEHLTPVTTRIRYSQVRLTGHDFLDIGTGGFADTNYPGAPTQDPIPANETVEGGGGRVFYTSTDQDGNFRVGGLFAIEQSTGVATLNADAFNISGLQELNLGNVTLGGGSATVTEFSTDPFFTADSDNVVPTQRAIKAYIASQIGGGGASLNVNSVTAGSIKIDSNQITNTTGAAIKMDATFEFKKGVIGVPLAFNYFLTT